MGPSNAIIGDNDLPTQLPVTQIPDLVLEEEKKLAKFSKSAEFQRLKNYIEGRIDFFQHNLPDGTPIEVSKMTHEERMAHWMAANIVIREFNNLLNQYEQAREAVKSAR